MQEPLIKASLDSGCLFPEQCCPSPTHGYPGALGIEISPEQAGNMDEIVKAINDTVIEKAAPVALVPGRYRSTCCLWKAALS